MSSDQQQFDRPRVPELDRVLGFPWSVLDDGFVRVIDYLGSDSSIVQAARVSYGAGTKTIHEDVGLIRFLMRQGHTTPFEMCEIKLHIRVPMDSWRQWIRHRTANVNEYSTRYSIAVDAAARTKPSSWRKQSSRSKQGSQGFLPEEIGGQLSQRETELQKFARQVYEERLTQGVAREQARKDLPLSTYTEAYWKIDLHNLFHFLELRMSEHAQSEIREYAMIIGSEIVRRWCPIAWNAFQDYRLNSINLSSIEIILINFLVSENHDAALKLAEEIGWLTKGTRGLKPNRERTEAEEKLARLGIIPPWLH